jgi:serine protease Do
VQALLAKPAGPVVVKSELPFWGKPAAQWPNFMKVVFPYLHKDWNGLKTVAEQWVKQEPASTEAWFYLAAAEYETHDLTLAEQHLHRVVSMNEQHSQAFYYLGLIAEANGKHSEALASVDTLNQLDAEKALELTVAMKTLP